MSDRTHIPNELQRDLLLEVGYRCPLCKQTEPLEFEHIDDWANVECHEFTNMIVLCASCHGRKKDTNNPRHINKSSLKKLKQNLMLLNGRYSDLERRAVEVFQEFVQRNPTVTLLPVLQLHHTLFLLVKRLADDGLVQIQHRSGGIMATGPDGVPITNDAILIALTVKGRDFIQNLNAVTSA